MEISQKQMGEIMVVTPHADFLDANNANEFKSEISPILQANNKVLVDMSKLHFIDSSGLGAVLSCLRKVNQGGGDLKLCGMSQSVRALCELVRMHRIVDIFSTKDEALKSF